MAAPHKLLPTLKVPTIPLVVQCLEALIASSDAGAEEVGALINRDPPLAGKVLRIANSSFYGLEERCASVEKACAVLGLKLVRTIVLQAAVIRQYEHLRGLGFDLENLWRHSVLVGQVCSILARSSKLPESLRPDEAYLAGLLHDVGQVVLLDHLREEYIALHHRAKAQGLPLFLVERRDLGTTHADVGAALADAWGQSPFVKAGIQLHHGRREDDVTIPAACLTIKANLLVERAREDTSSAALEAFDPTALKILALETAAVEEAVAYVRDHHEFSITDAA